MTGAAPRLLILIFTETVTGFLIGFLARLFFVALQFITVGIMQTIGLSAIPGTTMDDGEQVPALTTLYVTTATVIMFVAGLHGQLLRGVVDSYQAIPPGHGLDPRLALVDLVDQVSATFLVVLRIGSPFIAEAQGTDELLPRHWVNFIASAGEGPEVDQRRVLLGQAYLRTGQLADAMFCLQPAAEHGSEQAHELLQQVYALQAQDTESAASGSAVDAHLPQGPETADVSPSARPSAQPRPSEQDQERARIAVNLAALRKLVHEALAARRNEDAAQHCRAILEIDPNDLEAFSLLEGHCRKRRDYPGLRDLLLASTRVPGLPVDVRKQRLREIATLSESKLRDPEAAVSAWRGVSTLDPSDREALSNLKRLLTKAQHWDELAAVLEREALATTGAAEKAELIREIALLHRDRRKDPVETAEAFRQLYALRPDDLAVRDELCDLLLRLEQWRDAVPLLREHVATAKDEEARLKWSGLLASILHDKLADFDAAYAVCAQILELRPSDRGAFERMERVDEDSGNHARLLSTLERRVPLVAKAERPGLYMRMGVVAEQHLRDLDRAAEYFGDALDLEPDNADALARLVDMFERAQRYDQLVELLRERCLLDKDPKSRAPLHRRIAQALAEHLDDPEGAADAYRSLLEFEEDEPALRFLREFAVQNGDAEQLAGILRRLAACVENANERRDLWFELAVVLSEQLSRSAEASEVLKRILEAVDPQLEPAIELLLSISEASDDRAGVTLALERRLSLLGDARERLPLAKRLSDLCEREPKEPKRAIAALLQWSRDDVQNPTPRRRLRPLLEAAADWPTLLTTLDELSEWEQDFETRDEATIAAARTAFEHLADAQGAWRRLQPLVEERNEQAEQLLQEVARSAGLVAELSALYIQFAQQSEDAALQGVYWRSAADVLEHELHDDAQALEASLRMLATDLGNRDFLACVDRLAVKTKAFKRLSQVYDRLLKQADDNAEKVQLLKRHADLLENDLEDEALDRILRACALAPDDEALLARAEALSLRARRSEELLVVYDRRRAQSQDDESRLRLLLRAARLCDGALRDRARANDYLKHALATADASATLSAEVERTARDFDTARPDLGTDSARRALVQAHRDVAERAAPATAARLLLRGAELLHVELGDERGAFEALRLGLGLLPNSEEVYAALLAAGNKQKRLEAVDQHLAHLVDDAIDSATAVVLLRRRGILLDGPLARHQDAASVYTKLLQLRPDDADATHKLRTSLRKSGRHQDLLLALQKQLQRTRDPEQRLSLLKEVASTWERGLKNRWEALDAWKAVLREAPDDPDAGAAMQRLERNRSSSVDLLADGDASDEPSAQDVSAQDAGLDPESEAEATAAEPDLADAVEAAASALPSPEESAHDAEGVNTGATSNEAVASVPAVAEPAGDEGDLDALEASMQGSLERAEELDAFEDLDQVAIDVAIEQAPPIPAASRPPKPPQVVSRPPPIPLHGRSTPAPTAPIPQARPSVPGPSNRAGSLPPPLPASRGGSTPPPPLPTRSTSRPPPPLPVQRKPD